MSKKNTPEPHVLDGCLRYLEVRGIYGLLSKAGKPRTDGDFMAVGKKQVLSAGERSRVAFEPDPALATRIFFVVFFMCYRYYSDNFIRIYGRGEIWQGNGSAVNHR